MEISRTIWFMGFAVALNLSYALVLIRHDIGNWYDVGDKNWKGVVIFLLLPVVIVVCDVLMLFAIALADYRLYFPVIMTVFFSIAPILGMFVSLFLGDPIRRASWGFISFSGALLLIHVIYLRLVGIPLFG